MARSPALAALRYRNFRLLWIGQLISFAGSMMQNAAILWHVTLLAPGEKELALGLVGLVRVVPIIVFSLVGGVVADARNRRKLLLLTQTSLALLAGVLAAITFAGLNTVWPLYLLTALSSAASSFDNPARQSLIPNLVPPEHIPNAIKLNSVMFQSAAVLGPALGGLSLAYLGAGWVYLLNALSFLSVIAALLLMRAVPSHSAENRQEVSLRSAVEGLRFVFGTPLIRSTMLLDFFANFFASALALLPIFVQDILRLGPQAYGWLYAAPSLGAMVTSFIMVPVTDRVQRRGLWLLWSVVVYGLATVAFGLSRSYWLTFASLSVIGAADTVSTIFRNIIRQLVTPDYLRGRMTSVNMIFFMGGPQLGELEAGLVAKWFGAPISVISGGIGAVIATLWLARATPQLRRYRQGDPQPALNAAPAD